MGTGVGEAMLISAATGAAVGAGSSALTGGDPLKGALYGGLGGAVTGGIGGAAGAAGTSAAEAATAAAGEEAAKAVASEGINTVANESLMGSLQSNIDPSLLEGMSKADVAMTAPNVQSTATNQISGMSNLTPEAKQAYISSLGSGQNPQDVVASAGSANEAIGIGNKPSFGLRANEFMSDPWNAAKVGGYGGLMANATLHKADYEMPGTEPYKGQLSKFKYNRDTFQAPTPATFAYGGPVEALSAQNQYYNNSRVPNSGYDVGVNAIGEETFANGGITALRRGGMGIDSLGGYSDGGRMLKGPGDGMSDSIPARIGHKQEARLADGEFVVPADVVSHLGNGSTDAGAKQLYSMMDKVRTARTGRKAQGRQINPNKYVPA